MPRRVEQQRVDVALVAISAGATWVEAARRSGISKRTVARRLRTGGHPVMDPSAVILVLVDATRADVQVAAGGAGPPAGEHTPSKGRGRDLYA